MPTATPLQNDPALPISINFLGQSPHVFVYRFWKKEPGETKFKVIRDGDTVDTVPDQFDVGPFPDGTRIAWYVGLAGKSKSAYRFSVIFSQAGTVPPGGARTHNGRTRDTGAAEVEDEVVLT
jgi:hypothetical protein